MCSRYIKKHSDITEIQPKVKKTKTIQMKYPAPYSQSWSGPPQTKNGSSYKSSVQKLGSVPRRDPRPQPRCRGPDPTVPHLKYGLFPKKSSRGQSQTLRSKAPQESDTSEARKLRIRTPKEGEASEPLFVMRALDSRLTRRLTRAASTHLDIKPRGVK